MMHRLFLVQASSQPRLLSCLPLPVLTQELSVVTSLFAVPVISHLFDFTLFSLTRTSLFHFLYLGNLNLLTITQVSCLLFLYLYLTMQRCLPVFSDVSISFCAPPSELLAHSIETVYMSVSSTGVHAPQISSLYP